MSSAISTYWRSCLCAMMDFLRVLADGRAVLNLDFRLWIAWYVSIVKRIPNGFSVGCVCVY